MWLKYNRDSMIIHVFLHVCLFSQVEYKFLQTKISILPFFIKQDLIWGLSWNGHSVSETTLKGK